VRYIVAVAAGKGGVGKSTLACNLGLYFQKIGWKVGIMDADLYGPSLTQMLPVETPPSQNLEIKERIVPAECRGIKLISMAFFLQPTDPASVRAPIANGIIKQFIHLVDWGDLDILLIDFPPGTGDIQLTLIQEGSLSGAILITTPQEIALLDVAKATSMFRQMQIPVIGVIENMSYLTLGSGQGPSIYPFGQGGGERFACENSLFFLGAVPIEAEISRCCDQGKSLFIDSPEAPATAILASVAEKVKEQLEAFEKLEGGHLKNFELQWQK
jgi:ATP-binding protein involved in chromosome partitioning